ncbi:HAD-IA family hydrolase [Parasphingopyxis marina]|uniref:HAD-IA family hydrolase n=1 Tax=Parasphingopyxis marina TaxID=2761622 RepID=A0A842HWV7_9SPHN|nr:HAD-IA family hydrolase [Parasphingopyxis marina]MBC2776430.1 HAD-IA family hydrolase [Parasphingopyxis marina]
MSIRLAIFDCDGTLVDSQGNICEAMERAFTDAGLEPPPRSATRRVVGLSLVEAMQVLLPRAHPDEHVTMADAYKAAFFALRAGGEVHEPLYEGISETIDTLEGSGWLLGVATGKSDRGLAHVLAKHDLTHRFATLHTADRHPSKPHPSMIEACLADTGAEAARAAIIGDTSFDMAMGKAAGVLAVGVAWGYHEADELVSAGADIVAEHPDELAGILERIA